MSLNSLMMRRMVLASILIAALAVCASASQVFSFQAGGKLYTVQTTAIANSGFTFPGHGMLQPSVVIASPATQNYYMMLFNSNKYAYQDGHSGQAIFITYSPNGYSAWMTPEALLDNTTVDNICDMAVARPVFDGAQWRVYVQALRGDYRTQSCYGPGVVFMAYGSLCHGCLDWVREPGTNHAKVVIEGTGTGPGIGEDQQWFYTTPYGGPVGWPFMSTYNDWGYGFNGTDLFSYLWTQDMMTAGYWYGPLTSPFVTKPGFGGTLILPDAILMNSAIGAGVGLQSSCYSFDHRWQYGVAMALFPNLQQVYATPGIGVVGAFESTSSDSHGPRMFRPRLARNEHGYIPLWYSSPTSRTWKTYLYYNDAQINSKFDDRCDGYGRWNESDQRFRVSEMYITEQ